MPAPIARANGRKSKVRAAVEHVFAHPKGPMGLVVRTIGLARARVKIGLATTEHAHGMLAMEPGHRDELVQDAPFLVPSALAVSLDDRRHEPEFKWSSQHLERGGCDDCSEAAFGSGRARRVALAGSAFCCAA